MGCLWEYAGHFPIGGIGLAARFTGAPYSYLTNVIDPLAGTAVAAFVPPGTGIAISLSTTPIFGLEGHFPYHYDVVADVPL